MSKKQLALFGGEPTVIRSQKFVWPPITEEDIAEVVCLMQNRELSYYGREGEVAKLENAFCQYLDVKYG